MSELILEKLQELLKGALVSQQEKTQLHEDYIKTNVAPYKLTQDFYEGDCCFQCDEEFNEGDEVYELTPHTPQEFGEFIHQDELGWYLLNQMNMTIMRVSMIKEEIQKLENEEE